MRLEETLEYRCHLCLSRIFGTLCGDRQGSDGEGDDSEYVDAHISELSGSDIDLVFHSQHVLGVLGGERWAFTDLVSGFGGDDLQAQLFHDRDHDLYYLVLRAAEISYEEIDELLATTWAGIPGEFLQAAQLIELIRPEFRDKIVLSGFSLGGSLAAYAAIKASWPVRTIVFDPVGLNEDMMGKHSPGSSGNSEVLSDRFRSLDEVLDWYYIANSWVAKLNVERHLSSVGRVLELPQDPVRATNIPDTHDYRHVRFGLHQLWRGKGWSEAGILVSGDVAQSAGASVATFWTALEAAAVPIAVEYFPASQALLTTHRTIPVNAAAQQAIVDLANTVNPKGATVFRVILPKGAHLAPAVGGGYRGFATSASGKIATHARLMPLGAGGALVAGWPALAVAGTVMALDMLAQRELQARLRKVEATLSRIEEHYYIERIKDQRSADAQLTRAISLILDGEDPPLELALKSAYDVFHRSQVWLEKYDGVIDRLIGWDGKVDYKQLQGAVGGKLPDFFRELHLARAAISIGRKAMLADAAANALTDPSNPYTTFRRFLDDEVRRLEKAERIAADLSNLLSTIRVRGGWPDPPRKVQEQEHGIHDMASSPPIDTDTTVQFLLSATGEIFQLLPPPDSAA